MKSNRKAIEGRSSAPCSPSSDTPGTDHRAYTSIAITKDGWKDGPVVVHASWAKKLERQRDILRAELERIKGSYGHQSAPGCGCDDCAQIRPTEDALKAADSIPENANGMAVGRDGSPPAGETL